MSKKYLGSFDRFDLWCEAQCEGHQAHFDKAPVTIRFDGSKRLDLRDHLNWLSANHQWSMCGTGALIWEEWRIGVSWQTGRTLKEMWDSGLLRPTRKELGIES